MILGPNLYKESKLGEEEASAIDRAKKRILKNPIKQLPLSNKGDGTNRFNSNEKPEHDINWQYTHDDIQKVDNTFNEIKPFL